MKSQSVLSKIARNIAGLFLSNPSVSNTASIRGDVFKPDGSYDKLLLKALGDRNQVERLILYELRRSAQIGRPEAICRANSRWERDLMR
jgi:hypothetical protein